MGLEKERWFKTWKKPQFQIAGKRVRFQKQMILKAKPQFTFNASLHL